MGAFIWVRGEVVMRNMAQPGDKKRTYPRELRRLMELSRETGLESRRNCKMRPGSAI
jgi:hypothetical protein